MSPWNILPLMSKFFDRLFSGPVPGLFCKSLQKQFNANCYIVVLCDILSNRVELLYLLFTN